MIPPSLRSVAEDRRNNVAKILSGRLTTRQIIATGSMTRGTGLSGYADVDVIAVLDQRHCVNRSPTSLLQEVRDTMATYNAKVIKKNGQAVTLYFSTWPNVDLVPAQDFGGTGVKIPDMNTERWILSFPDSHDRLVAGLSQRHRQLIVIAKCWNKAHSSYVQSFHIDCIVAKVDIYAGLSWDEHDWPYTLWKFFDKALEMTGRGGALWGQISLSDDGEIKKRLEAGRDLASKAWDLAKQNRVSECVEILGLLFGTRFPSYG